MAGESNSTTSSHPSKAGGPIRRRERAVASAAITEQAILLYKRGLTLEEVGDRLGIEWRSVWRRLAKSGVPRRHVGDYLKVRSRRTPTWEEYFGPRTRREGACIVWIGLRCKRGYGRCKANFAPRIYLAHRMSWFLANGPFDLNLHVRHACDNPPCVNPEHLALGEHIDNMRDMTERGRRAVWRGEDIHTAKLTEPQVLEIRELWRTGEYKQGEIAQMFGVDRTTVCDILRRKRWRHL